ncbi:MAG: thiosulfate oxidation carrier protein SoxY [Pseudomonadota bacterium]
MELTRRNLMALCAGSFGAAVLGLPAFAAKLDDAMTAFTGGATPAEGGLTLTAPEIAENGATVPIQVAAPGAVAIALFSDGNPEAKMAEFTFGPLNPTQFASTRVRLQQTQNVFAIAKMADGSFVQATANVKVTIGGCGG